MRTPLTCYGGKQRVARQIVALMPAPSSYTAAPNSGRRPAGSRSRCCESQLEHATEPAARDAVEVAEAITAADSREEKP